MPPKIGGMVNGNNAMNKGNGGDKRTAGNRLLDMIAELNAVGSNERIHILARIDAYLEIVELAHRDPHVWMKAVHNARDLIRQDLENPYKNK